MGLALVVTYQRVQRVAQCFRSAAEVLQLPLTPLPLVHHANPSMLPSTPREAGPHPRQIMDVLGLGNEGEGE
jgi:hypothetical protein